MQDKNSIKFDVLRQLAVAGASGEDLSHAAESALSIAAQYVGLTAAALYIWDDQFEATITVTYAESEESKKRVVELEKELFARLRKEKQLLSAYMSFGGQIPSHSFSLPLLHGNKPFGAVIGLQEGKEVG